MRRGNKQVPASQKNLPQNEWTAILTLEIPTSSAVRRSHLPSVIQSVRFRTPAPLTEKAYLLNSGLFFFSEQQKHSLQNKH